MKNTSHLSKVTHSEILLIDGTTKEGQQAIAKHYGVSDEWNELINNNVNNDVLTQYYDLLYLVKTKSEKDHVWISFVEGLHRHAAIVLSLLCSKFDYQNNTLVSKSLDITNFEKAELPCFTKPTDSTLTPERLLNDIFLLNDIDNKDSDSSTMLKTPFNVRAYYPSNNNCDTNTLISTLRSMSSSHSKHKLNSAQKSISSVTAEVLTELTNNSTAEERNNTNEQPTFETFLMKYIEKINKQYESKLQHNGDDTFMMYPSFLITEEWLKYINNPYNSMLRDSLINTVCPFSTEYNKHHQPPFGIHFENLTNNSIYATSNKKFCAINSSNVNAYFIIPPLVHSLVDKLNPNKLDGSKADLKVNIIHYLTRFEFGTKAPNLHIHPALNHYCSQANNAEYIQDLSDIYKVIPVTAFLVTLYNASFMFNDDKSGNFLISALSRFDLGTTVMDDTFMDIMSKFLKYMKYASFSKL
jgi:hypothetical protein